MHVVLVALRDLGALHVAFVRPLDAQLAEREEVVEGLELGFAEALLKVSCYGGTFEMKGHGRHLPLGSHV